MRGHRISLRVKAKPCDPSSKLSESSIETELLIDGKKAGLVQSFFVGLHADSLVPFVLLKLIPGELDIEIDSPVVLKAALAEAKEQFFRGLDGCLMAPPLPLPSACMGPFGKAPRTDEEAAELTKQAVFDSSRKEAGCSVSDCASLQSQRIDAAGGADSQCGFGCCGWCPSKKPDVL